MSKITAAQVRSVAQADLCPLTNKAEAVKPHIKTKAFKPPELKRNSREPQLPL